MFPSELFGLITPFPRDDKVFVAMSFDTLLDRRWSEVIEPGVKDAGLQAFRVDASKISDSIITEIERGIATARLVLADISLVGTTRNANVMYEVGLAHAVRPHEVILFRSDLEKLLFDLSPVRVNKYDPDHSPSQARQTVREAVAEAIKEIDVRKSLAVDRAASSMDEHTIIVLVAARDAGFQHPAATTMSAVLSSLSDLQALSRVLDAGLVRATYRGRPLPEKGKVGELIHDQLRYENRRQALGPLNSHRAVGPPMYVTRNFSPSDGPLCPRPSKSTLHSMPKNPSRPSTSRLWLPLRNPARTGSQEQPILSGKRLTPYTFLTHPLLAANLCLLVEAYGQLRDCPDDQA